MIQTWDWLFLHLPRDEEKQRMVLENMESRQHTEIKIRDFVLKFDFENSNIYCDCLATYEFKHKVVPGKVPFALVKEFLVTKEWDSIDETKLELLI